MSKNPSKKLFNVILLGFPWALLMGANTAHAKKAFFDATASGTQLLPQKLRSHSPMFKVEAKSLSNKDIALMYLKRSDLRLVSESKTPAGTHLRFQQQVEGVDIYGADVAVHINAQNVVYFVTDNSVQAPTKLEASFLQKKSLNRLEGYKILKQELLVSPANFKPLLKVLAQEIETNKTFELLIDRQSEKILERKATQHYSETEKTFVPAKANVFHLNPVLQSQKIYGTEGVEDLDGGANPVLDALSTIKTLPEVLQLSDGNFSLESTFAKYDDTDAPRVGDFIQKTPNWDFKRNEDAFFAVNTFYHLDQSLRYIQSLGFNIHPYQYTGGLKFDSSSSLDDNSFYSSDTGRLAFGYGGVNDAEDHDVVLHELGHAIHDWITNGNLSNVEGLSEGSGDYWAMSYSRKEAALPPTHQAFNWVFSWDGHNPYWPGRVTNYEPKYSSNMSGGIHTLGQIWATTLMKIYDVIGKEKTDKVFLETLSLLTSNSNQQDAANALVVAAKNLNLQSSLAEIESILTAQGYALVQQQ